MQAKKIWWVYSIMLLAVNAVAQNTFPASGNVGIGTTAPGSSLDVRSSGGGNIYRASDSNGQYRWRVDQLFGMYLTNTSGTDIVGVPQSGNIFFNTGGNVGIGTANPGATLDVKGAIEMSAPNSGFAAMTLGDALATAGNKGWVIRANADTNPWHGNADSLGFEYWNGPSAIFPLTLTSSGNIGIGTSTPGSVLEVNGNLKLTSSSGASLTFADGTIQSTAWNGTLCGGDYAESVDITGERAQYQPGDVLVIDPNTPGKFLRSVEPYSTAVAGIYSTKPGMVGRRQTAIDAFARTTEVPMAMVGIVPTKVRAENGPIKPGDTLVTSSTLGHAMKGTDRSLFASAVVGKALGRLDSGTGVIEVLVSLQ